MKIDIKQLEFIDPILREIALSVEEEFGEQTVTSLYRIGGKGVHSVLPLRGLDHRCRDKREGDKIAAFVNKKWKYDPKRPNKVCCMCHDVGKGIHLHYQVHPNTVRL